MKLWRRLPTKYETQYVLEFRNVWIFNSSAKLHAHEYTTTNNYKNKSTCREKQHFDTENKTTLFKHSPFKLHSFKAPEICFSFSDFRKNIFWL